MTSVLFHTFLLLFLYPLLSSIESIFNLSTWIVRSRFFQVAGIQHIDTFAAFTSVSSNDAHRTRWRPRKKPTTTTESYEFRVASIVVIVVMRIIICNIQMRSDTDMLFTRTFYMHTISTYTWVACTKYYGLSEKSPFGCIKREQAFWCVFVLFTNTSIHTQRETHNGAENRLPELLFRIYLFIHFYLYISLLWFAWVVCYQLLLFCLLVDYRVIDRAKNSMHKHSLSHSVSHTLTHALYSREISVFLLDFRVTWNQNKNEIIIMTKRKFEW